MKSAGKYFFGVIASHRSCGQRRIFWWQPNLAMCKGFPCGTCSEGVKAPWTIAVARHCERSGEAIGEDTASVMLKTLGLKMPWREAEAWHYGTGLETLKRAKDRVLVRFRLWPQNTGDARSVGWPPRTTAAVEWNWPEPTTSCVCYRWWSWRRGTT